MDFQKMLSFFNNQDDFARNQGMELVALDKGYARAKMLLGKEHTNGMNIAHGGVIFTLADFAFAAASNSHGWSALSINVSITYHKAVEKGILSAEAREISCTPKLATYLVTVYDAGQEVCASFQGMVYRTKKKLGE